MSKAEPIKVNINDFKIEELTLEEQEAFNYFNENSSEVTFETNIDGDKFLEALGIKKEDNFGKMQYRISTLLNLITKQQKEIEILSTQNAMMSERHFKDSGKLKTWKKIAEKLAEGSIAIVKLAVKKENYDPPTKQELLDWAKSEVLKDE